MLPSTVQNVAVLGGGSAGFIAALTLKRRLPNLKVTILRSPDIGIIGVGEGTTVSFPRFLFETLKLKPLQFYMEAQPTWKLGLRFLWGPRAEFYYPFAVEYEQRYADLSRNSAFYLDDESSLIGPVAALMAEGKAFMREKDGQPHIHKGYAFHIENKKLVAWLERVSRDLGVEIRDVTVTAEAGPNGVEALLSESGERITADLYVDCSGFRSELLGRTLHEPYISYDDTLFCDRAVIGGWDRTTERIEPFTLAETMDAGWCWRIDHENFINRGYVYSSKFISDDDALTEFLTKNPQVSTEPRVVKFRTGRCVRNWVGNVVGIGNSVGFVEPLEATALQIICIEALTLADSLAECNFGPTPTLIELYNRYNTQAWDDIRDFLAVHYRFNTRLDTPFWQAARADTKLHGAEFLVDYYRENGPSPLTGHLIHQSNSFGVNGYLALLLGQRVPHGKPFKPTAAEQKIWNTRVQAWQTEAKRALDVKQCLDAVRSVRKMPR